MIKDVIREAWANTSPAKFIAAVVAAIVAPFVIWAWYVVVVEALHALGVPK